MDSINTMLANVGSINYSSLESLSDGTYNKGEIILHKGIFGGYSFEKVNNHVGSRADKNTVVCTADQNRLTKAAVFKAIVTRFAKSNEQGLVESVLDFSTDAEAFRDALDAFENPYIKVAYTFLMGDGAPLTRDEMRLLDNMLKEGGNELGAPQKGQVFRPARQITSGEVTGRMETLKALKRVKVGYVDGLSDDVVARAKEWIKGLSVTNISAVTKIRVTDVSTNVLANTDFGVYPVKPVIARYMPKLYNSCTENLLKVSWPTAKNTVDKTGVLEMVRCISAGLEDKINAGWAAYEQAVPEGSRPKIRANPKDVKSLRPVTKDDIKAAILSKVDAAVEQKIKETRGKGGLAGKVSRPVSEAAQSEMNDFEKSIYKSLAKVVRGYEPDEEDLLDDLKSDLNNSIGEWD